MDCCGYLFDTGCGKYFGFNSSFEPAWFSNKRSAKKIEPSKLLYTIEQNDLTWMLRNGVLQFHLESI